MYFPTIYLEIHKHYHKIYTLLLHIVHNNYNHQNIQHSDNTEN